MASDAHKGVSIDFDDIELKQRYSGWKAYKQSKLANILFTYELSRRLEGTNVTANTLHPGFVRTNFLQVFNDSPFGWLIRRVADLVALSPEQGALTSIYLATSPEVEGVSGRYFVKQKSVASSPQSRDQAAADAPLATQRRNDWLACVLSAVAQVFLPIRSRRSVLPGRGRLTRGHGAARCGRIGFLRKQTVNNRLEPGSEGIDVGFGQSPGRKRDV